MPGSSPFLDSMNKSIDVAVPLALQLNRLARAEKAAADKLTFEKQQWVDQVKQAKEKSDIDRLTARLKMGIEMTPQDVLKAGGTPKYEGVSGLVEAGGPAEALRMLSPNISKPTVDPVYGDPERENERGGPSQFAISGQKFVPPVPLELEKLKQTLEAHNVEAGLNRQNALDVADIRANATGSKKEPEQWSDPYTINVAGKPVTVRKNLLTNKVEKIAEDVSTTVRVNQTGSLTDKDIVMPQIRALPKLKVQAQDASRRVRLYQDLSAMAEKGAGGLVPGLKGILSPVLEALGMDATIESEAQAYQLMARAGVGSMRLMLVGSGQVSNYEQDLMQRLSGGSIKTSREAAKLLFGYYAVESKRVVDDYNQTVADVSEVAPEVGKVYRPIQIGNVGGNKKTLDAGTAKTFLQQAGGDKEKARKLAKDEGYTF